MNWKDELVTDINVAFVNIKNDVLALEKRISALENIGHSISKEDLPKPPEFLGSLGQVTIDSIKSQIQNTKGE